ncbi:hypothetical protein LLG46_12360 [bacterium]|nr:hypothetical protein [bacterium]
MNNRIPIIILGVLVLVAIVYRIANPPQPPTPGPKGYIPTWISMSKVGDMGPWQVNPSGQMWAGAWSETGKEGKTRSAIWVIDLEKLDAKNYSLNGKVEGLGWSNDKTVNVMISQDGSKLISINTDGDELGAGKTINTYAQAPVWPVKSDMFIAAKGGTISVCSTAGKTVGKEVTLPVSKDTIYGTGAISADGSVFVISTKKDMTSSSQFFYLGNTTDGSAKHIFDSEELPGRVEGIWVSSKSILIICSERDKFDRVVYDIADGKLQTLKSGQKLDIVSWPDAPKDMMFVSYAAGYDLALASGKTKKLFGFENLRRSDESWRSEVQGGRLYPRKDGSYTSVSFAAGAIDIRTIEKDGARGKEILPRM